jgi:hypothetical protein
MGATVMRRVGDNMKEQLGKGTATASKVAIPLAALHP